MSRPTAPASIEPLAMPTVDGGRLDQHQRVSPPRQQASQDQPKQAVNWAKSSIRTSEYAQLVAQGKALEQQVSTRRPGESNRCDRPRDVTHFARRMTSCRANVKWVLGRTRYWRGTTGLNRTSDPSRTASSSDLPPPRNW